ncbi:MAG: site-specific integrase, partial [SAR324 cluster bacterium]|nr:site-specific integrase [SAR324 cluster bacterium]
MSNLRSQGSKNYEHNVFAGIPTRQNQEELFTKFLSQQDISDHTVSALILDIRKVAKWFSAANQEPWDAERVTVRDITDFREYLRQEKQQAASTINRNLASIRKYFKWLFQKGHIDVNPTISIKELKRQPLAPQG